MQIYDKAFINNLIQTGFDYCVSDDILNEIKNISQEVGSPNYIKTPIFTIKTKKTIHKKNKKSIDDSWVNKSFKKTQIINTDTRDNKINELRLYLNKLSNKNYIEIINSIITILDDLEDVNIIKISPIIFELASNNRFYSTTYSEVFSTLVTKYPILKFELQKNLDEFIMLFDKIEYIDPNTDYDKFCENNKTNEKRKSLCTFFVNLMHNNMIEEHVIVNFIWLLTSKLSCFIHEDNKKNHIDELCENIFILYNDNIDYTKYKYIDKLSISEYIKLIATSKSKDFKSLSNKTIFKFMDLLNM